MPASTISRYCSLFRGRAHDIRNLFKFNGQRACGVAKPFSVAAALSYNARVGFVLKMPGDKVRDRIFVVIFVLLSVASTIPIWLIRILPMQDIWQHLALVDVIHNYWAPGSIYPDYFILPDSPKPNLFYYYFTHLIAFVTPSLEFANKVVLTIYVLAFPASYLFLLRSFGRSKWLALFSFPFVFNAMFYLGFVSFALAMPMLFAGLGAYRRFLAIDDVRRAIGPGIAAAVMLVWMYFTHAHVFLMAGMLFGTLWLLHVRGLRDSVFRIAPFAPSMTFFVPWFWVYFIENTPSSSGMPFGSADDFFGPKYYSSSQILSNFFNYIGNYFRRQSDDTVFVLMILLVLVLLIVRRAPEIPADQKRRLKFFDLEILTLVLGASVLILPHHIQAQAVVSLRHILPAFMFFVAWPIFTRSSGRLVALVMAGAVALSIAGIVVVSSGFIRFQREVAGYAEMFDKAAGGRRLLKIANNQDSRVVNAGALWHIHHLYGVLKGGVSDMQFAERPHNPIQYKPGMIPPIMGRDFTSNPAWRYYDYILVRKEDSGNITSNIDSLELIAENKGWSLFAAISHPKPRPFDAEPVANGRRKLINDKDVSGFSNQLKKPPEVKPNEGFIRNPIIFMADPGNGSGTVGASSDGFMRKRSGSGGGRDGGSGTGGSNLR